jgi:hypothetical protein
MGAPLTPKWSGLQDRIIRKSYAGRSIAIATLVAVIVLILWVIRSIP